MTIASTKSNVLLLNVILFSSTLHLVFSENDLFQRSSLFTLHDNCYLSGHVISSITVTSCMECAMNCNIEEKCQSWNLIESRSGYLCELNDATKETKNITFLKKENAKFGQRVTMPKKTSKPSISFMFTSLGSEGKDGPTDVTGYNGTSLEGQVTLNNGIQEWTVPHTGTYEIEARGASGLNGTCNNGTLNVWHLGGLGAKMRGKFDLKEGTKLRVLVGQLGTRATGFKGEPGGGGGGTFVTFANNTPLIIAGGGGGGGGCIVRPEGSHGDPGQHGELGTQCQGTRGQGGLLCSNESGYSVSASGGAGLLGDGEGLTKGPSCFVNGGTGGSSPVLYHGGFGGGGYAWLFGGGGGGYSGGGVRGNSNEGVAGGGGSFNIGLEREAAICETRGSGFVNINLVS